MPDPQPTDSLPLAFTRRSAMFSADRRYRYSLTRRWDIDDDQVMFLMLNPSTADAERDDPTIRRCIRYAQGWGFGALAVGNLFAFRATDPSELRRAEDPVGSGNDRELLKLAGESRIVVAAWGNHGSFLGRDAEVRRLIPRLHVLRLTGAGQPQHPLYLKSDLRPIEWANGV